MQIEIRNIQKGKARISSLVTSWLVNSVGLLLVSRGIKGVEFRGEGASELVTVLLAAAVLGLVNVAIKPVLLLLTLPINLLSLGFFTLVINAACLGIVSWFVPGFVISGFWPAFLGALLLSLISLFLNAVMAAGGFRVKIER